MLILPGTLRTKSCGRWRPFGTGAVASSFRSLKPRSGLIDSALHTASGLTATGRSKAFRSRPGGAAGDCSSLCIRNRSTTNSAAREQGSVGANVGTPRPRVVVGMPVYNSSRWLRATIASWLGQSWSDFRLIISDNASNDSSFSMCQDFARVDPRVIVHRNPCNVGVNGNFRHLFELGRDSDYFVWASSHDFFSRDVPGAMRDGAGASVGRRALLRSSQALHGRRLEGHGLPGRGFARKRCSNRAVQIGRHVAAPEQSRSRCRPYECAGQDPGTG